MSGEGVEVAVHRLDVHFLMHAPLCAVHQHRNAVFVRRCYDFRHGVNKA